MGNKSEQSAFSVFTESHSELIEDFPPSTIEQIFEAGRLAERENILDLIANGVLIVAKNR